MTPRLWVQNCKFFMTLLSLNSQKWLEHNENQTKYRKMNRKPLRLMLAFYCIKNILPNFERYLQMGLLLPFSSPFLLVALSFSPYLFLCYCDLELLGLKKLQFDAFSMKWLKISLSRFSKNRLDMFYCISIKLYCTLKRQNLGRKNKLLNRSAQSLPGDRPQSPWFLFRMWSLVK